MTESGSKLINPGAMTRDFFAIVSSPSAAMFVLLMNKGEIEKMDCFAQALGDGDNVE
jgi:hypothetical protein